MPPTYSIVIPIWNEAETIPELHRRLVALMDSLDGPVEVIFVDDGSRRDNSLALLHALHRQDPRFKVLHFSRNFGHQIAITAGLDYAQGDAVIIMDGDLQDPPEAIPKLIAKWKEGYEVVYAVREKRLGETWFKTATAWFFYRLITRLTNVDIPLDTGDFRLMDRQVVEVMRGMREQHRFMRGLSAWIGFRQTGVPYVREARFAGETHYPIQKMVKLTINAITSFSYFPLQLATYLGFALALVSLVLILMVILLRLSGAQAFVGQASTLIAVLFLGGVQLLSLGILGEYIGRIHEEVKGRPLYIVADAWGFDPPALSSSDGAPPSDVALALPADGSKEHSLSFDG